MPRLSSSVVSPKMAPIREIQVKWHKSRKRSRTQRGGAKKKKRATKADLLRAWGILPGTWMRYSGLKGVFWYWFSRTIRDRDYEFFEGRCMTCSQYVPREESQAGHLFAAKNCGFALLFEPLNVHLQHSKCNNPRFTPQAGVLNTRNIMNRYGKNVIDELIKLQSQRVEEWSKAEYEEKIRQLPAFQREGKNLCITAEPLSSASIAN